MVHEKIAEECLGKLEGLIGIMAHNPLVCFEKKWAADEARPVALPLFWLRLVYDGENLDNRAGIGSALSSKLFRRLGH